MGRPLYTDYMHDRAIQLITLLGFIFGITIALLAYIASTYFKEVVQSDNVSVFYILIFLTLLAGLLKLNRIIEGFGRARTLMTLLAMQIGILFILQFLGISWIGAVFLMTYYVLYGIIWVVFDIILEAYSKDAKTGRVRGAYLSVWNFGFLIGPMFSMFLLERYGFDMVFFVSMILYVVMFLAVFVALNDIRGHVKRQNLSTKRTVNKFRQNKSLIYVYWISFTLRFFYAAMTIYMPLYLRSVGLSWGEIGVIFSIMLVPFIIVQYPAGVLADKKFGEKEMLFIGLMIMACSLIFMRVVDEATFVFWATILFASRIGAALVEAMLDSYFYKQINENDISIINFFRTTRAVAYIVGSAVIGLTLAIVGGDISVIFIVLFVVIVIGLIPVILLKDTVPQK
jgi:MFS family permease